MTKTDVFNFLQQFNGINVKTLGQPISSASCKSVYNYNYYAVPASDDFIFYADIDDEDNTAWYLCDNKQNIICCFGESSAWDNAEDEKIEVFEDIKYFDWEDTRMLED